MWWRSSRPARDRRHRARRTRPLRRWCAQLVLLAALPLPDRHHHRRGRSCFTVAGHPPSSGTPPPASRRSAPLPRSSLLGGTTSATWFRQLTTMQSKPGRLVMVCGRIDSGAPATEAKLPTRVTVDTWPYPISVSVTQQFGGIAADRIPKTTPSPQRVKIRWVSPPLKVRDPLANPPCHPR